jgi:hypothetical protein
MKKFIAIYMGSSDPSIMEKWKTMPEGERKKKESVGMQAWMNWSEKNSKFIKDNGSPLGKTKRIDKSGISDMKNLIAAYTIVEAESHEAAAKLFLDHPHFTAFPGQSIEIMECLPLPTM